MARRAISLDALGTLLELQPPLPRLRALLRDRHGLEVSEADGRRALRAEMGHYRAHCIRAADAAALYELRLECAAIIAAELGLELEPAELLPALLDSLRFEPYPEVADCLRRWRTAGLRLVVASNWDISLHDVLRESGLSDLVDAVVTSAEVGSAKPAGALFAAALSAVAAAPAEAVHVGDSLAEDVEGALAVGIEAVWLRRDGADGVAPAGVETIASLAELGAAAP